MKDIDARSTLLIEEVLHTFTPAYGAEMHDVDTAKFDKAWSTDRDSYIGAGGTGNTIGNRYTEFKTFFNNNADITTSHVSVWDDGSVHFINGRHRFAYLRDRGMRSIPVSFDADSVLNAVEFGYVI